MEIQQTPLGRAWTWLNARRTAVIAIIFWFVLLAVTRHYMTTNDVDFQKFAVQLQTVLTTAWYGPLLYLLVYLLRPVILFPASLLTILGGNVFGLWPGFLYVLIAGTVSAAIPYAVGRWFAKGESQKTLDESAFQRFIRLLRRNPFQAVLTMRLIYLPYDAVSLLAGSLRIPFLVFMLATLIGNVAGTLSFVGVGASIKGDLVTGEVSLNPAVLVFSGIVLITSIVLSRFMSRSQTVKTGETS